MSDDVPFYSPFRQRDPPKHLRPGEVVWTLRKGTVTRQVQLRDQGGFGMELQIFVNDEFRQGQLYPSRAFALGRAADAERQSRAAGGA